MDIGVVLPSVDAVPGPMTGHGVSTELGYRLRHLAGHMAERGRVVYRADTRVHVGDKR